MDKYSKGIKITGMLSCLTKNPANSIIGKRKRGDKTAACSTLFVKVAVINPKLSKANPFIIEITTLKNILSIR